MSMGLRCDQEDGRQAFSFSIVAGSELGELAVAVDEGIAGHDARTAGVGNDGEARALGNALAGQQAGTIEDFVEIKDADDSGAAKGGLIDGIDAGHRAGMRCGGLAESEKRPAL